MYKIETRASDSWGEFFGATNGAGDNYYLHVAPNVQPTVPARLTVRCPYCRTKNKADAPRCESCGGDLPD